METRGCAAAQSRKRPAIPRRSCDQCRSRKVACDRGSPCSSCDNAKICCTHTTVVSRAKEAGQRIIISAKYKAKNLPPLDAAVLILKWAKENHSNYIVTWLSHILPLERLVEICQKVYFSVHGYTEVEFILTNGTFYWLYTEYAILAKRAKFHKYSRQCCENFQDAFSRLPFLLPASMEVIAALAMGSLHAIEHCKDVLAWTFSSSSSHLCQTLGFHQNSFLETDGEDIKKAKQRLFFTIYRIDKSLSLRLGRSSNIQEYNMSLACESMDMRWNKSANIQVRVYDELYSSFGLSRSYADRLHSVKSLSGELQMLIDVKNPEANRVSYEQSANSCKGFDHTISSNSTDVLLKAHLAAEQVELLSVLTLIHRAALTPESCISPDCFEAASKAMDAHQYAITALQACTNEPTSVARYINRIILNMPFVPFIVLFRQCIETSNPVDLARLGEFVTSLQPLESSSKSARRRQVLFQLLHKLAQLYVQSGSSPRVWNQSFTDDEFNHYLNILGFTTTVPSFDQEFMPTITNEFTSEMTS